MSEQQLIVGPDLFSDYNVVFVSVCEIL